VLDDRAGRPHHRNPQRPERSVTLWSCGFRSGTPACSAVHTGERQLFSCQSDFQRSMCLNPKSSGGF
jgi:hypothetical protein